MYSQFTIQAEMEHLTVSLQQEFYIPVCLVKVTLVERPSLTVVALVFATRW